MPVNEELRGLCSVCINACGCVYLECVKQPVLQCEEFEGYPSPPSKPVGQRHPGPVGTRGTNEEETSKYRGLCAICAERESCTFPKPEGGVWFCEEYK